MKTFVNIFHKSNIRFLPRKKPLLIMSLKFACDTKLNGRDAFIIKSCTI